MRGRAPTIVLAGALVALAACQSPDVGQPCTLAWGTSDGTPPPDPVALWNATPPGGDYFETGNLACENLVCIVSPAPQGSKYSGGGYCSKPCVSDGDCYKSETGLVCRQMVLDETFMKKLDPAVKARYLSDIQFSSYCAVPAP